MTDEGIRKPDFSYWAKQTNWSLPEAAALFVGIDPHSFKNIPIDQNDWNARPSIENTLKRRPKNDPQAVAYFQILDTLKRDAANSQHTDIEVNNKPARYMEWAENKSFEMPHVLMKAIVKWKHLHEKEDHGEQAVNEMSSSYCTPDMQLMFDAVNKFWLDYNLANPDPSKAPYKKQVVNWLLDEAKKRKLPDFSKSRAETMDTIMRCPTARRGGNSQ